MNYFVVLTVAAGLLPATVWAQTARPTYSDTVMVAGKVMTYVEQMPVFPGGQVALYQTLGQTISYPTEALQKRLEGRVFVSFVVSPAGIVEDIKVSKGLHPLLDAEAVRAVSKLPAWQPGRQNGRFVPVAYTLPIGFRLPPNVEQILAERTQADSTSTR
ncbi:energy transducer TonB [Hymenobacter persicinus]|uniref:Energy transducer TonB n=1 Tax=Hymenobacter persicinus TaxID=2025506 RepID=A0A4Q5LAW9_9BACT|nr:energy transducer TonB [Hymenobacter persicinus]RYU78866.1 energy transducer TonB [Hymenobacter persicinus]